MSRRFHIGQGLSATIAELDRRGRGAAFPAGSKRRLVVPGTLPEEVWRMQVMQVGNTIRARPVEPVSTHPRRRSPPCRHHGDCTGCPLMPAAIDLQHAIKGRWLAPLGVDVEIESGGPEWGYRWSAKRIAFDAGGVLRLGSYRAHSHEPADMSDCQVDHPAIRRGAEAIAQAANAVGVAAGRDLLAVWLRTNRRGEVLACLVCSSDAQPNVAALASSVLGDVAGVYTAVGDRASNNLRGRGPVRHLAGVEAITVTIAGVEIEIGPLGFLQPNPLVVESAYRRLTEGLAGERALDLYAGAGITTALLRPHFERVDACDTHVERDHGVVEMDAGALLRKAVASGDRIDAIVANPPRKGLGVAVCDAIGAVAPRELRIMSCNPATMVTDAKRLATHGYRVVAARGFDTLPHTAHIEVVVALTREGEPPPPAAFHA